MMTMSPTLEASLGSSFMGELQSPQAPVSAQRVDKLAALNAAFKDERSMILALMIHHLTKGGNKPIRALGSPVVILVNKPMSEKESGARGRYDSFS
ncbi:hypothetical protein C5167_000939 [Papaver somniferum]|uniref:Uncharacterized protein n=1 Tax=Papaver somniferum TaxID=3469 RepID=A0A4Y7KVE8_PAPSO|nr:hypothetical protein C5167_000939 [Papaver somniferum]